MDIKNVTLSLQNYGFNGSLADNFTMAPYRRKSIANVIGCFTTIVIAVISVLGNAAVIAASFWSESLRLQTGNILIVFLSITDILTAILVMLPSAAAVMFDYWPFGWRACKAHTTFNYAFACASSCNMAFISFDRVIAVLYPLKYRTIISVKILIGGISFILFQSFAVGLSGALPYWSHYDYTEGVCALDYTRNRDVFKLFHGGCFVCYYVPAIIVGICNFLIIFTAYKSGRSVKPIYVSQNNKTQKKQKTIQKEALMSKTSKSMMFVVVTYYICFSPYALSKEVKVCFGYDTPPVLNYFSTILIFIASVANPFIYAILRKDYRDAFKKLPRMIAE
ncbi:5-hydroxytryptamine receptor 4-like isoform X2 [Stegodyphus dumicola]|uniref:5-hydroxytryptamine receptor 4-like isoform X2 n=1 Tax=Stegodyphus dumicola TaxID=202533 RepID=UPI0015AEC72D|nr:5-hydroxytryptamine receptor 4-like isoform X2 [Stegodyphus dumicola]